MSLWVILAAVCAVLATLAGQSGQRVAYVVSKPLPLLLLIVAVATTPAFPGREWLLLALALAWLGDVALLLPARFFLLGLLAFLLAHLAMMQALLSAGATLTVLAAVLALAVAALMSRVLWPRQRLLRVAVTGYCLVLALMVALAAGLALSSMSWLGLLPAALLFALSDGLLGWNKFRQPLRYAQLLVLSSYFLAQILFVCNFLQNR
ncbi:lysoplasmalogenase [Permianibacter sp. IMCC34836]|uniref:lysoplasmalogenase family protein n=1 Tax=Permianibacter fluminis TaxID=2738515 RepID=UPI00155396FF|nr:lysoplasmalogenase family protein [Permianibacter fluminis]NQD36457.1 lysoplasmalogenase [Permianibacter fluminis]